MAKSSTAASSSYVSSLSSSSSSSSLYSSPTKRYNEEIINTMGQIYDITNELSYAVHNLRKCFLQIVESSEPSFSSLEFELYYTGANRVSNQILTELRGRDGPASTLACTVFTEYLRFLDYFIEQTKKMPSIFSPELIPSDSQQQQTTISHYKWDDLQRNYCQVWTTLSELRNTLCK